ncbi:MAG: hypothetical protein Q7T82_11000 [Armatimonadota bacterium]|nr:hypothetical protein [Armatimonadota bacterium]
MRKLCFVVMTALLLTCLGSAGPVTAEPSNPNHGATPFWFFQEGFEYDTTGDLQTVSNNTWIQNPLVASQILVEATNPYAGAKDLNISDQLTDGAAEMNLGSYSPSSGIIYFHFRVKSPAPNPVSATNTYYIYLLSNNGYEFGRWYGNNRQLTPRVGGKLPTNVPGGLPTWGNVPLATDSGGGVYVSNGWHELDFVHDTNTMVTTWYADGVEKFSLDLNGPNGLTGTPPNYPSTALQKVTISDASHAGPDGTYLVWDDVAVGTDVDDSVPTIIMPEDNCSGDDPSTFVFSALGTELDPTSLAPTIEWTGQPHTHYQVKIFNFNTTNPDSATGLVWDSTQVTSTEDFSDVPNGVLSETPTYYVYVRLKINGAWKGWSPAGRDFKVEADSIPSPFTPYFSGASPADDGWYRSLSNLPTFEWSIPPFDGLGNPTPPHQSFWLRMGTNPSNPTDYVDTDWVTGPDSLDLDSLLPAPPSLIEDQIYYARVRVRNGCMSDGDSFPSDPMIRFKVTEKPVVLNVAPNGGAFIGTQTPTITWTVDSGSPTAVTGILVRVTDTADSSPPPGGVDIPFTQTVSSDPGSFTIPSALPANKHLYAHVRLTNTAGMGDWSPNEQEGSYPAAVDPGGFYIYTSPAKPVVTAPAGTYTGAKPMVVFTSDVHNFARCKITTDAGGTAAVWDSGMVTTTGSGLPCTIALEDGHTYYAFAKVSNPAGESVWSDPSLFLVDRNTEMTDLVDVRHMDEVIAGENILTHNAGPPNDGFNKGLPNMGENVVVSAPALTYCGKSNSIVRIENNDIGNGHDILRLHRVGFLDLNKGVTFIAAVRVQDQTDGGASNVPLWQQGQMMVVDSPTAGVRVGASFRVEATEVGICTDNTWSTAARTDDASTFAVIRITGRNQSYNDFSSTLWKLYVNESASPAVTATGTMDETLLDPSVVWMQDCVVIGHGHTGQLGNWEYDWTAVNVGGDYAPGEWDYALDAYDPVTTATRPWNGRYASIGSVKGNAETIFAKLNSPAVVTKRVLDVGDVQVAYFAQDDTGGIRINSSAAVAEGQAITAINGVVPWWVDFSDISTVSHPNPQAEFSAAQVTLSPDTPGAPAIALAQKNLGTSCLDQNLGSSYDTMGMFVRIFGKLVFYEYDAGYGASGAYIYYVDDGSGAIDGRAADPAMAGIRIAREFAIDPGQPDPPAIDSYWMIEGIASYETTTGPDYFHVRSILMPTFTQLN